MLENWNLNIEECKETPSSLEIFIELLKHETRSSQAWGTDPNDSKHARGITT